MRSFQLSEGEEAHGDEDGAMEVLLLAFLDPQKPFLFCMVSEERR